MNYSVVIPTYERRENLTLILDRLARSVSCRIQVMILTEPGSNSLPTKENLAEWSEKLHIKIAINTCNVGVDESILRAYEACNSDWIYFLGDSKLPVEDFEKVMKSANIDYPMATAYFFCYDTSLNGGIAVHTIEDLIHSGLTLGDFILGGNSIFSRRIVEKYIRYSYRALSSRIAHVAMPIIALSKGEPIFISNKKIIEKFIEKPATYQPGKALLDCWASFSLLALLPITYKNALLINKYVVNYETNLSRLNFFKYSLLKIFREKTSISKDLLFMINTRYIFYKKWNEWMMLKVLYFISMAMDKLR